MINLKLTTTRHPTTGEFFYDSKQNLNVEWKQLRSVEEPRPSVTLSRKWDITPAKLKKAGNDRRKRVAYDARADEPAYQRREFRDDDLADFRTKPVLRKSTRSCSSSDPFILEDTTVNLNKRRVVIQNNYDNNDDDQSWHLDDEYDFIHDAQDSRGCH